MSRPPNSKEYLRPLRLCWKIAGATKEAIASKPIFIIYNAIIQICVTTFYPFHLQMGLFSFDSQADNMKNLAVCVTCTACSLKFLLYAWHIREVDKIEALLQKLDERIQCEDEKQQFKRIRFNVRGIIYTILGIYAPIGIAAELSFIFKSERGLLYPAWFPFNWRDNNLNYFFANFYQIVGISYQILMNYVDDCFPAICLCLLAGHTRLLAKRVSKIGHENETVLENEHELLLCIEDQMNLYELFDTIQALISLPMFIQITVSAVNMCVGIAALVFYVDAPLDFVYYFVYCLAMPSQIFPTCYFGSEIQICFSNLHYAAFSRNWTMQTRTYKKHLLLFAERSLKKTTAFAGGMIRIHLDTFFSTCKGAYSLFTVIMRLKK